MTNSTTAKRLKHHHREAAEEPAPEEEDHLRIHHQSLLPGIPDHIAQHCLSSVPPSTLYSVCRRWGRLIYSPSFPPFLSLYALLLPIEVNSPRSDAVRFCSFDPISRKWHSLPPPPLSLLFQHPSFISRKLPIQSVTVSGNLVVLAATDDQFRPALSRPLVFDPSSKEWSFGPRLSAPRRWCAAGALRGTVYVASGIGSHYNNDVARSVEKWRLINHNPPRQNQRRPPHRWIWETMGRLKDGKFSREAIDAVGWRGKLCMVNVKGDAAKEGIIHDVAADVWEEMPDGMLAGWRGPAAAMDEETIYAVDESRGSLRRYDHVTDTWEEVLENTLLKGAQHVAAARGKVCVVCGDGASIAVIGVSPARLWVVDAPDQSHVAGVHILPRFNGSD